MLSVVSCCVSPCSSVEVIVEAVNKAAIQLSVFHNSDRAKLIAQEACMQLEELQNSKAIFQWESKCVCMSACEQSIPYFIRSKIRRSPCEWHTFELHFFSCCTTSRSSIFVMASQYRLVVNGINQPQRQNSHFDILRAKYTMP